MTPGHALAVVALFALAFAGSPLSADLSCNFESGFGRNSQGISSSIPGLIFSTLAGDDVYFADINSGWYSVTSDNGKVYEDGEYFVSADVAAYVLDASDKAKISLTWGPASYFTVGYSSQHPFYLEAYDGAGNLLASTSGTANGKSNGGTGLSYLTVSHPDIAYVLLHDQGGYWMIDNISTDAVVPEPGSLFILALGAVGLFAKRRS